MYCLPLEFAKGFVAGRITADVFAEAYILLYQIERDRGQTLVYPAALSECLSTMFCQADMYCGEQDRQEYEYDAERLVEEIGKTIALFESGQD